MKLIEGGNLSVVRSPWSVVRGEEPPKAHGRRTVGPEHGRRTVGDFRRIAELMITIARAVHHAHQRGIMHRDLKPSNILIDADRRPHVSDFGLAKKLEREGKLTQSGAIVGTPEYMAPEQAKGEKGLTYAVDVYGLGAILYFLLTGKPPFQGDYNWETLKQVVEQEPVKPRALNRKTPRDLETICLTCLRKDPKRRYDSAENLAKDLEKWLEGKPIEARPVTRRERLWKWAKRKPAAAALLAVSLTAAMVIVGGGSYLIPTLLNTLAERTNALKKNSELVANLKKANKHLKTTTTDLQTATTGLQKEQMNLEREIYADKLAWAKRAIDEGQFDLALQLLAECQWNLRGWEHDYLNTLCRKGKRKEYDPFLKGVTTVTLSRSALGQEGLLLPSALIAREHAKQSFTPSDSSVITGLAARGSDFIWSGYFANGLHQPPFVASRSGFSPDAPRLGRQSVPPKKITSIALSESGDRLAGYENGNIRLFPANQHGGIRLYPPLWRLAHKLGRRSQAPHVAFSPNGKLLAVGDTTYLTVWDLTKTPRPKSVFQVSADKPLTTRVAFSSDNRWVFWGDKAYDIVRKKLAVKNTGAILALSSLRPLVATESGGTVSVWTKSADGKLQHLWKKDLGLGAGSCRGGFFREGGRRLIVVAQYRPSFSLPYVFSLDSTTGEIIRKRTLARGAESRWLTLKNVDLSADGKWVAGLVKGRDINKKLHRDFHPLGISAPSGNGKIEALQLNTYRLFDDEWRIVLWNAQSGDFAGRVLSHYRPRSKVTEIGFAPDNRHLIVREDDYLALVDLRTRSYVYTAPASGRAAVSPDGRYVACAMKEMTHHVIGVWNAFPPEPISHRAHGDAVMCISSNKSLIFSGGKDGSIRICQHTGPTLKLLRKIDNAHEGSVTSVFAAPRAMVKKGIRGVLSAGADGKINLWNVESGELLRTIPGHTGVVWSIAVSWDGEKLISAGADGMVRVWDARTGERLAELRGHRGPVYSVCALERRQAAVSVGADGAIRLWDLKTGQLLAVKSVSQRSLRHVKSNAKGICAATEDGRFYTWNLKDKLGSFAMHGAYLGVGHFTHDGKKIVLVGDRIRVWDTEQNTMRVLSQPIDPNAFAVSRDEKHIALAGTTFANVLDLDRGDWQTQIPANLAVRRSHKDVHVIIPSVPHMMAFSADGKKVVLTTSGLFKSPGWNRGRMLATGVFSAETGELIRMAPYPLLRCVRPDGNKWFCASEKEVFVYDSKLEKLKRTLPIANAWSVSPDGNRIAAVKGVVVEVWNIEGDTCQRLFTLEHSDHVADVAFLPGGSRVITAIGGRPAEWLEHMFQGNRLFRQGSIPKATETATIHIWDGHIGTRLLSLPTHGTHVARVDVAPGGRSILASTKNLKAPAGLFGLPSGRRMSVQKFDAAEQDPRQLFDVRRENIQWVCLSPNGRWAVTITDHQHSTVHGHFGRILRTGDQTMRVLDLVTGKQVFASSAGPFEARAISSDRKWVVTDRGLWRWNPAAEQYEAFDSRQYYSSRWVPGYILPIDRGAWLEGGKRFIYLRTKWVNGKPRHNELVDAIGKKMLVELKDVEGAEFLAASQDGRLLAIHTKEDRFEIWRLKDARRISTFGISSEWVWTAFSHDGSRFVSVDISAGVRVWDVKLMGLAVPRALPWAVLFGPFRPKMVDGLGRSQGVALGCAVWAFQAENGHLLREATA